MKDFESYDWKGITYPANYIRSIFEFAQGGQFKNGLEIGFDQGASALAFLRACPDAHLKSYDVGECIEGVGRVEEVRDRLEFVIGDSRELLKTAEGQYDYIYIDGDHLYDAVRQDLFNCDKLLAKGGFIVVDDCDPNHSHFGVHRAVEEFKSNMGYVSQPLQGSSSCAVVLTKIFNGEN